MSQFVVSLNFNSLHQAFSARTGRILERAAFLLTAAEDATTNHGLVPNVKGPTPAVKLTPRPVEVVRPEGARWITECAIRDCLEEVQDFLEEVRKLCAAVGLSERGEVPGDILNIVVFGPSRKFDRLTLPEKIARLRADYGAEIIDPRVDHILTLNVARNCLVHRGGVVTVQDCNEGEELVVRWASLELHARRPSGDVLPVSEGEVLEAGTQILAKHVVSERRFSVGESIAFTTADLCGIWMMLHFFGIDTSLRIVNYAKSKGFVFKDDAPGGDAGGG
ncbi:hypothetical protein [Sorangium sp. So ce394]|uniref:hypothetical protein n=1 Tax=Sorangium sp. So ce394 TaxID=3133310 RepID=UPI003F5C40E2